MTKINFTSEQQEIYNKLLNFIKTPCDKLESNEYILVGYAGTGKTTLVTSFINNLIAISNVSFISLINLYQLFFSLNLLLITFNISSCIFKLNPNVGSTLLYCL